MTRWLIFQPKDRLFRAHHERLKAHPDPEAAEGHFQRRLRQARKAHGIRVGCYAGIYFAVVAALVGAVLARLDVAPDVRVLLEILTGVSSTLTVAFLAGLFLASRFEALVEIELHYYSAESRMPPPPPGLT